MVDYKREESLPPIIGKFENFYFRYKIGEENSYLQLEAWEVQLWDGETPIFLTYPVTVSDPEKAKPLFEITVKFDGCSHLRLPYFHFDTLEQLDQLTKCIKYIWNDLCPQNGVAD